MSTSESDILVARLRKQAALEIDRLVEFLDRTDGYAYDEREGDDEDDGNADDEPSLGSLDRRMNQTQWARADYTPKGCEGASIAQAELVITHCRRTAFV
jgi:hypothetical protein